ncbi:hypothetical protein [Streptomyces shenzhenensis]|uniref:hypothetical protein n=1 Tax=Streptomyces shenzhenensis TaxID=943815 RepID=UPI00367CA3E3
MPARADLGAGDLAAVEVDVEVVPVEAFVLAVLGVSGSGPLTVIWSSCAARSMSYGERIAEEEGGSPASSAVRQRSRPAASP